MKNSFYDMIKIKDWAGNLIFQGMYYDEKVLKIMQLNEAPNDDIFVYWCDETRNDNVYEFILF